MKLLRLKHGWTQEEVAQRAGLDYKYYQKIESGRWPGLQIKTVETIAKALKTDAGTLFTKRPD
jgi:transcriptional regulator with XRE-family HTH domain